MSTVRTPLRYALTTLLCMPAVAWTIDLLIGTPPLILVAAIAPAALFACAIVLVQRGAGRPVVALAFSLAWGAIGAAFLSTNANAFAREWLDPLAGDSGRMATALLAAPAVEEAAKAAGLVLLLALAPACLRGARDGIVHGSLIGVGFVATENLLYLGLSMLQGGEAGLTSALYLRGILGSATHLIFTACAGAGIGWSVTRRTSGEPARRQIAAIAAGFVGALAQHMAWNGMAAPMLGAALCGAEIAGGSCRAVPTGMALYGQSTAVAILFLAPGASGLLRLWRRTGAAPTGSPSCSSSA